MRCVLLLALAAAAPASADVINGDYGASCPPMTCPPATNPIAGGGHGGCPVGCTPNERTCTSDAECNTGGRIGTRCVETRYCIAPTSNGRMADVPTVMGEIDSAGNCGEGTPTIQKLCTNPPRQSASDEGACAVGGTSSAWPLVFLLLIGRRT